MAISFIRSIILYSLVCVSIRFMGKRQIGELQPFELVVAIMVSDLATVPLQETSSPLLDGIVPILTVLLLQTLISLFSFRNRKIRHLVNGRPRTIIENGVIKIENMRKELFSIADLCSCLRYEGYEDISTVHMAILETNGQLSIIPNSENKPVVTSMLTNPPDVPNEHSVSIIIDGQIEHTNLNELNKSIEWLYKILRKNGLTRFEDIFYACTLPGGKIFLQTYNEKVYIAKGDNN